MRPLFGPRTVGEAALLVAVPVIALEVGLRWPAIIGAGAVGYLLVLAVEGVIWREGKRSGAAALAGGAVALEVVPAPAIAPEAVAAEPEPAPAPETKLPPGATVTRIGGPRQWNIRDLEQLAGEHVGGDPIADEERTALLVYLRDFAAPDGLLPVDFDDLVRQSFGELVPNQ
jgi:hypothetical protein